MYKSILQSIDNIAIWPIISFVIFFLFFCLLLWYVFTADKQFIQTMSEQPLHKDESSTDETTQPL